MLCGDFGEIKDCSGCRATKLKLTNQQGVQFANQTDLRN